MIKKLKRLIKLTILSWFGFASCGENAVLEEAHVPYTAYGSPYGLFRVDIKVTDEANKPIKGIKVTPVIIHDPRYDIRRSVLDPISSDYSGKANKVYNYSWVSNNVRILFEDIDGDQNGGSFAKDSILVKTVQTKEPNGWFAGDYSVSAVKRLKKEQP